MRDYCMAYAPRVWSPGAVQRVRQGGDRPVDARSEWPHDARHWTGAVYRACRSARSHRSEFVVL